MIDEAQLPERAAEELLDAITCALLPESHCLVYPIADLTSGIHHGRRLLNFVWYRNVAAGDALDALLTDRTGVRGAVSVHPGQVRETYVAELHDAAGELPPPMCELVRATPEPFLQAVVDVEVPRMVSGRVCLVGDAAFTARPHAAAGTAKAAENAWTLREALEQHADFDRALAAWETSQLKLGRELVARAREMGERSQLLGTWRPDDPDLHFGLYGPGH